MAHEKGLKVNSKTAQNIFECIYFRSKFLCFPEQPLKYFMFADKKKFNIDFETFFMMTNLYIKILIYKMKD